LTVRNVGTGDATGVALTEALPGGFDFISAVSSQGSCSESGGTVACDLGDLDAGGTILVSITVVPWQAGSLTDNASVSSDQTDAQPADNTSSGRSKVVIRCTIVGTNNVDVILGTEGIDVICGKNGRDVIHGL